MILWFFINIQKLLSLMTPYANPSPFIVMYIKQKDKKVPSLLRTCIFQDGGTNTYVHCVVPLSCQLTHSCPPTGKAGCLSENVFPCWWNSWMRTGTILIYIKGVEMIWIQGILWSQRCEKRCKRNCNLLPLFLATTIHWLHNQYKFSCPTTSLCSVNDSVLRYQPPLKLPFFHIWGFNVFK